MREDIKITTEDLKTCVQMIATLTGMGLEKTIPYLELYYHVRRTCELGLEDEDPEPEDQIPEQKEMSPSAKGAKFKQETRERMMKISNERSIGIREMADMAGVSDNQILLIMESKPVAAAVYRQIAEALDKLEEE